MNILNRITDMLSASPKTLFLIDGLGALVSACSLGIILPRYEYLFGMPKSTLMILAALPCFFMAYDLFAYLFVKKRIASFLRGIAIINFCYCLVSIYFLYHHQEDLTSLGYIYFIIELLIVFSMILIEFKTANNLKN